jgi:hypothetical protein
MTIKKSDFFLNFMMFRLDAIGGRRIGDPYLLRHLAAKSADLMLVNLPYWLWYTDPFKESSICCTVLLCPFHRLQSL